MNARQLDCFIELAESKNFAAAAENLYLSPSTVSYQIKKLEEELGFSLFVRNTHQVELTRAGQFYLTEVKKMIGQHHSIVKKARRIEQDNKILYVGFIEEIAVGYYAQLYGRFTQEFKKIRLRSVPVTFDDGVEPLKNHRVDMMFTYSCRVKDNPEFSYMPIVEGNFYCVVNQNDTLAKKKTIELSDLSDHNVFVPAKKEPWLLKMIEDIRTHNTNVTFTDVEYYQFSTSLVKAGLGVAICPYCIDTIENSGIVYKPFYLQRSIKRVLAWRKEDDNEEAVRIFRDLVKSVIQ